MSDPPPVIDYIRLRRISPEAARQAVLDYLASVDGNVSAAARAFGVNRRVVYDILRRARSGSLADHSFAPHHQPRKTPPAVEARVVAARNQTGFGDYRLSRHLAETGLHLPPTTIHGILARNRDRLDPPSRLRLRAAARKHLPPPSEEARRTARINALLARLRASRP
jgi:transposase-like protein